MNYNKQDDMFYENNSLELSPKEKEVMQQLIYGDNEAEKFTLYCNHCSINIGIENMVAIERTPNKVWAICFTCGTSLKLLTKREQSYFKSPEWDGDGYIG